MPQTEFYAKVMVKHDYMTGGGYSEMIWSFDCGSPNHFVISLEVEETATQY